MYHGSCDLGLAREDSLARGLWLALLSARATLFLQSLLIRDTLFTITAACAKSESRAVLVLIVLVCTSLPCCPACPASCGLSQLSLGGIRHFPVHLYSSFMAGDEQCPLGHHWPEPPPLRGFWALR